MHPYGASTHKNLGYRIILFKTSKELIFVEATQANFP